MCDTILQTRGVGKSYSTGGDSITVLENLDFTVHRNEWVAVLGSSGSGKTTLLNILGTLEKPDSGSIVFNGDLAYDSMSERAKAGFRCDKIGFVFQAYHMFPELSVFENVRLPAMLNGKRASKKKAAELLDKVGLAHRLKHKPTELSGGEQQRGAIARALVNSPDIILADEPTGNLDSATGERILEVLRELHRGELRTTIVMITHDLEVAGHADRKVFLKNGAIQNEM
ncbi:MAG: ABC transporter ATP-binding protein [Kiritimatiellaeota bacterium]|nr:ABC transporter ATP-binding protein [Kiritimatiellota bacterium]